MKKMIFLPIVTLLGTSGIYQYVFCATPADHNVSGCQNATEGSRLFEQVSELSHKIEELSTQISNYQDLIQRIGKAQYDQVFVTYKEMKERGVYETCERIRSIKNMLNNVGQIASRLPSSSDKFVCQTEIAYMNMKFLPLERTFVGLVECPAGGNSCKRAEDCSNIEDYTTPETKRQRRQ